MTKKAKILAEAEELVSLSYEALDLFDEDFRSIARELFQYNIDPNQRIAKDNYALVADLESLARKFPKRIEKALDSDEKNEALVILAKAAMRVHKVSDKIRIINSRVDTAIRYMKAPDDTTRDFSELRAQTKATADQIGRIADKFDAWMDDASALID